MDAMMPAGEGPYPMMNGAPADQQPEDLAGAFAIVDSILWRDGGLDDNEWKVLMGWIQQTMMQIKAQEQEQAMGGGQTPGAQAGLGASSASEYNPEGGAGTQNASLYSGF